MIKILRRSDSAPPRDCSRVMSGSYPFSSNKNEKRNEKMKINQKKNEKSKVEVEKMNGQSKVKKNQFFSFWFIFPFSFQNLKPKIQKKLKNELGKNKFMLNSSFWRLFLILLCFSSFLFLFFWTCPIRTNRQKQTKYLVWKGAINKKKYVPFCVWTKKHTNR